MNTNELKARRRNGVYGGVVCAKIDLDLDRLLQTADWLLYNSDGWMAVIENTCEARSASIYGWI